MIHNLLTVFPNQFLSIFQVPGQRDHKPVSAISQTLKILLAAKSSVHHKAGTLSIDRIVACNHIIEMRFIGNASGIHSVLQRQAGFFSVVCPHIDLKNRFLSRLYPHSKSRILLLYEEMLVKS